MHEKQITPDHVDSPAWSVFFVSPGSRVGMIVLDAVHGAIVHRHDQSN
jgi:hypothetical protein